MTDNWKRVTALALLTLSLAAAGVAAGAEEPKPPAGKNGSSDTEKALERWREEIRRDLKLDGEAVVKKIEEKLDAQRADLDRRLKDLEERIARLENDRERTRTSEKPPSPGTGSPGAAPSGETGRIRLSNRSCDTRTVVVNGKAYGVGPGETRDIDPQPAGTFTYEVRGVQALKTAELAPNEVVTITVHQPGARPAGAAAAGH